MLSKNKIKLINALSIKKSREKHGLFIAEGEKVVREILYSGMGVESIYATAEWLSGFKQADTEKFEVTEISRQELDKISRLYAPNNVLCIVKIPVHEFNEEHILSDISVVLENINDPGNLGTIIRTAHWFGIKNIICSPQCVDIYNPKVVQATMGSLAYVKVHYKELAPFIYSIHKKDANFPVYAAVLKGDNIYKTTLQNKAMILFGSEAHGISENLLKTANHKITIPSYGNAESLNVSVAAAIFCSEFKRNFTCIAPQ